MEMPAEWILWYAVSINALAFALFGLDKHKARTGRSRISEATLFFVSLVGGVFGGIAGMALFRHKTRKAGFIALMFLILLVNIGLYYYFFPYDAGIFFW